MSEDNPRLRLRHMLEYAARAQALVAHRTEADMERDDTLRLAVERLIEIIGEAAAICPTTCSNAIPRWRGTRLSGCETGSRTVILP